MTVQGLSFQGLSFAYGSQRVNARLWADAAKPHVGGARTKLSLRRQALRPMAQRRGFSRPLEAILNDFSKFAFATDILLSLLAGMLEVFQHDESTRKEKHPCISR